MFQNPNPYNIPTNQIRPPQNQVNIAGGAGGTNPADAFEAFSRLYLPVLQNQDQLIGSMSLGAMPPEVQRSGMKFGDQPPTPYQPASSQDFQNALFNMFSRAEDVGTLSKYSGFAKSPRRY